MYVHLVLLQLKFVQQDVQQKDFLVVLLNVQNVIQMQIYVLLKQQWLLMVVMMVILSQQLINVQLVLVELKLVLV